MSCSLQRATLLLCDWFISSVNVLQRSWWFQKLDSSLLQYSREFHFVKQLDAGAEAPWWMTVYSDISGCQQQRLKRGWPHSSYVHSCIQVEKLKPPCAQTPRLYGEVGDLFLQSNISIFIYSGFSNEGEGVGGILGILMIFHGKNLVRHTL